MSRQCAHKFTSANYTAAIRSKEPIREPDPYLNHGCQNHFTHQMPEEIYAGHTMLPYLFSTDLVKVWVLEPIPYLALFCVCIKETVVCQKMAPHQLFKPAVKMNSTKHQKSGEYWKWWVFSWLIPFLFLTHCKVTPATLFPLPIKNYFMCELTAMIFFFVILNNYLRLHQSQYVVA